MANFFTGAFKWETAASNPIVLAPFLLSLVVNGRARPGFIVSDVISIEDAPDAYSRFERHELVKAVIAFD
ncbi:hypothetical protein CLAFUW4_08374 [Fulvia fulva]|uniref:Uncharacterized protein n=1 Tax=Passalora fulva TaxID=5499 RepID=A0A9Q8LD57_PASFU|nr:uncharacterized protein CLAFUR5_08479 [Fulvia fulva]KAK4629498.1 hypothetical protein CLAFUR4_08379 [Fulvia fulva]KAK4630305.1 hypothetical protein CLAFUR0_08374 [Fulvia fulva]UJO15221.1 hypothetical protein CLAFUR5_08479 [Fulvia fulva]WPV12661.1 hypothetical protein CLAFUW4_08374 [Fulvia fulva]WPV27624.1 hypothetical protein CLAFUW7_08374 [Fulvia fulva]